MGWIAKWILVLCYRQPVQISVTGFIREFLTRESVYGWSAIHRQQHTKPSQGLWAKNNLGGPGYAMDPITQSLKSSPEFIPRLCPQSWFSKFIPRVCPKFPTIGTSGFKALSLGPKWFLRDFLLPFMKIVLSVLSHPLGTISSVARSSTHSTRLKDFSPWAGAFGVLITKALES